MASSKTALLAALVLSALFTTASRAEDCCIPTSAAEPDDIQMLKAVKFSNPPKVGLALGGGGARGAALVGALRVLQKAGIKFDYVAGTSIGAVVGGFYCSGVPLDELQEQLENGRLMRKYMTVPLTFRVAVAPILLMPKFFGSKAYDGMYKGNKFRKYLLNSLPAEEVDIEKLKIDYCAVALNLVDGIPYRIENGNLGYAMQASSAVPTLRKPVQIGEKLFVDGGVVCNLPVKQVREMGAEFVIAINIDEPFNKKPLASFRPFGSVAKRVVNWGLYELDRPQETLADILIHPDTTGIGVISTSKKDARDGIKAGEVAANAMLPLIVQKLTALGITVTSEVQHLPGTKKQI